MERYRRVIFKVYFCFFYLASTEGTVTITNQGGGHAVIIKGTLTLMCSITRLSTDMIWDKPGAGGASSAACYCPNTAGTCGYLINDEPRLSCSSDAINGEFTLRLKDVTLNDEGTYRCRHGIESAHLNISVKVPITSVEVTSPTTSTVTVMENVPIVFVCTTSTGKPHATIQWQKKSIDDSSTEAITQSDVISTSGSGESIITTSTLQFRPDRTDHGYRVFCTAYNIDPASTLTSTRQPQLYIQYNPAITGYASGASFKIIADRQQSLTCTVQGGIPPANLSWDCFNGNIQDRYSGETVSKQVTWTATMAHGGQRCTCQATQPVWSSPREVYVVIDALYPPTTPTFTVQGQPVSGSVNVIEDRDVSVRCSSSGNPSPGYTWTPRGSSTSADTLTLTNVQISEQGDYTCTVTNTMVPSQGARVTGSNSSALRLNVLYAPTVNRLANDTAVENSEFTKMCSYIPGNPNNTMIEWTGPPGSTFTSRDQTLTISQVSKANAGKYMCTAKNNMVPTGESVVTGIHSQKFQLVVYYSASIPLFSINSQLGSGPFTYEEKSTITVRCDVDSNPGSQIRLARDDTELRTFQNTREATHVITKITCLDAGMYSCAAQNPYNGNTIPKMTKQVFVRCPPRPLNTENNQTYYAVLNGNVTLSIEFTAYPPPTSYIWYKLQQDNRWTELTVGKSSSAHYANLSIENIKEEDFGQYRIDIVNSLDTLVHLFFVSAQGTPDAPGSFSIIGLLNIPILFWVGGANHGYKQTFVIEVSHVGSNEWTEKLAVAEEDRRHVLPSGHYIAVIEGMPPGSYMARILSRNVLGRSKVSQMLSTFTVSAAAHSLEPEKQVSVGAIAGGVVAGIEAIVIVAIVTVVMVLRQRSRKDSDKKTSYEADTVQMEEKKTSTLRYYNVGAIAVSTDSMEEQQPNVYEKLGPELKTDGLYDGNEQGDAPRAYQSGIYQFDYQ